MLVGAMRFEIFVGHGMPRNFLLDVHFENVGAVT
jgi:hypothetical protein